MPESSINCWKCGKPNDLIEGKVGFRAECYACGSWLHTCKGCKHYKPGLPNSCRIPDTEHIADREAANFCDEFVPNTEGKSESSDSASDAAKRLFGDDDDLEAPPSIDSLFKD